MSNPMTTLSPLSVSPTSLKIESLPTPPRANVTLGAPVTATKANKPKSRKRVNTAEKRNQHNAIERQRRETLNVKFLSLARLLPSLASHRRPSKSAIVNGSISHLTHQRNQRLLAAKLLRQVCAERDELFAEVNEWRKASGYGLKEGGSAWTNEMDEIVKVEKETFGNFASVGGDNGEDEEQNNNENDNEEGQDQSPEMDVERASAVAGIFGNNGLFTPRSSADSDAITHANTLYNTITQSAGVERPVGTGLNNGQNPAAWSSDFLFGVNNVPTTASSNVPFNAFLSGSSSLGHSSSGSPNSYQGSVNGNQSAATFPSVLTPPSTDKVYGNHTPSPQSSNGAVEEVKTVPTQSQWTPEQMHHFRQPVQQQNIQRQQQQTASAAQHSAIAAAASSFMPAASNNGFTGNYPIQGVANFSAGQAQSSDATDIFTQSLMATMFAQQRDMNRGGGQSHHGVGLGAGMGMSAEQVQQWRQIANNEFANRGLNLGQAGFNGMTAHSMAQPSIADLKNAVRHGMSVGLGMAGVWPEGQQNHTLESF